MFGVLSLIFLLLFCQCCGALEIKPEFIQSNKEICARLGKNPYFDVDIVVNKRWRVYHTWNLNFDVKCLDVEFRNATKRIIKRIWSDMHEYLEQQPYWVAATLLVTIGPAKRELLLFADQGPAGSFLAVPNVSRDSNFTPIRTPIPLLSFQMKLLRDGKFLLIMDCELGATSLAASSESPPYRSEIAAEVAALNLGDGLPVCTKERNTDEQIVS